MKLKDRSSFFSYFLRNPCIYYSLPHTNKGISQQEKEHSLYSYVCQLSWYTCPPNITNMLSIKTSSILISVSEKFLEESEWGLFLYKISFVSFLRQGSCIYVGHSFSWHTFGLIILICLLGMDHSTSRGGYGFSSKKIFWFPMLLKKIFWFWWRKKKIWFRLFVI